MTQEFTNTQIIDIEFNEQARRALKQSGNAGGLASVIYRDLKLVRLYDAKGRYVYDFNLAKGTIAYKTVERYAMDEATKKMVKRFMIKDMMPLFVMGGLIVVVFVAFVVSGIGSNKAQKQTPTEKNIDAKTIDTNKSTLVIDSLGRVR